VAKTFEWLQKHGLLNADSGDMRDLIGPKERAVMRAFCSSRVCAGAKPREIEKPGVPRSADYCPDCEYALRWRLTGGE
jgi:hypothetical protein